MRAFIISQPKSGTYLCSNLLVEWGLDQTALHLTPGGWYYKYDLDDPSSMANFIKYLHKEGESFKHNLNLIPENGFAVGHIAYQPIIEQALESFKLIVLTRPRGEVLQSIERFKDEFNREIQIGDRLRRGIGKWKNKAFHLTFDDMINKNIEKLDELQIYLFGEIKFDSEKSVENALNKKSITKSSIRK